MIIWQRQAAKPVPCVIKMPAMLLPKLQSKIHIMRSMKARSRAWADIENDCRSGGFKWFSVGIEVFRPYYIGTCKHSGFRAVLGWRAGSETFHSPWRNLVKTINFWGYRKIRPWRHLPSEQITVLWVANFEAERYNPENRLWLAFQWTYRYIHKMETNELHLWN